VKPGTYCGSEKDFLTLKFEEVFHGHVMLQRIINFTTWLKYVTDLTGKWEIAPKGIIKLTEGEVRIINSPNLNGYLD
jgi:hypothetical protein